MSTCSSDALARPPRLLLVENEALGYAPGEATAA